MSLSVRVFEVAVAREIGTELEQTLCQDPEADWFTEPGGGSVEERTSDCRYRLQFFVDRKARLKVRVVRRHAGATTRVGSTDGRLTDPRVFAEIADHVSRLVRRDRPHFRHLKLVGRRISRHLHLLSREIDNWGGGRTDREIRVGPGGRPHGTAQSHAFTP